jgi:methyl-accepting chemotaxis protein
MAAGSLREERAQFGRRDWDEPSGEGRRRGGINGWWDDLSLRRKMLAAFSLIFLFVAAQSAFVFRTIVESRRDAAWVQHTDQVIFDANDALGAVINMETGLRGYYLTGREEFLAPYNDGRATFSSQIVKLKTLTADNPAQTQRWVELEGRVATWLREVAEPGIALRREVNAGRASIDAIATFVSTGTGKAQTDGMRAVFATAITEETRLLEARTAANIRTQEWVLRVVLWSTVLIIVLGALVAYNVARDLSGTLGRMARVAGAIAEGRQDQRIDHLSRDEVGQLAATFRRMIAYQNRMAGAGRSGPGGARRVAARSPRPVVRTDDRELARDRRRIAGRDAQPI